MRPIRFGLATALIVALLAPAAVVSAAKAPKVEVSAAQRKQGMAEAPALAQAAGLPCAVSDARFIGKSPEDKKKGTPASSFYEVACAAGEMGYVLQGGAPGAPVSTFTCIETNTPAGPGKEAPMPCALPGNADPKAALGPLLAKAGTQCVPEAARGVGQTKTETFLEVACQGGAGYIVVASAPFSSAKPLQAQNCLAFDNSDSNVKCTLGDHAKRIAVVDAYATQAANGCAVKDRRYIGMATDGSDFFEAACQDGKGYVYKIVKGALSQTIDCAKAQGLLGGCTLTDARQAQTEQAALYTRLSKTAGSDCDVASYAEFPMRGNEEVVEMVCKSGNSAIGIFPGTGKGQVLDCGHALVAGYKCSLGKVDYSGLTADLRKFVQKTCVVSNARPAAKTAKGTIYVEVACTDGYKGYMIEYNPHPVTAIGATGCAFAGGCKLPGNT